MTPAPNKGMITTTKPIPQEVVAQIKAHLAGQPRELCYFTLAINSALRSGDILRIKRIELERLPDGRIELLTRERKTGKLRRLVFNRVVAQAIENWLDVHPKQTEYLFEGMHGKPMTTGYWAWMMKKWCREVGWEEDRVATHSARKTFVKTHYQRGAKLATLMHALNHSSERQTLAYMGILGEDIEKLYDQVV